MKLTGNLKKIVYNAKTKEEAKAAIEDAGMILNDEELDEVSGGCICTGPKLCTHCRSQMAYFDEVDENGNTIGWVCTNPNCITNKYKHIDPNDFIIL